MLKTGTITTTAFALQCRHLQTTSSKDKYAALKGHWWTGKHKKGALKPVDSDIINGARLERNHQKFRFSYLGKHKYEWDPTEPIRSWDLPEKPKPNYGQYERTDGDSLVWDPKCGYTLKVEKKFKVFLNDKKKMKIYRDKFSSNEPRPRESVPILNLNPYPSSLTSPMVWRFMEKIKWKKDTGLDRSFDIMADTFQIIKLTQMASRRANPDEHIELDCNKILEKAVANVSPAIRIDFVEVTRKVDGFKPCPVPLTTEQSTNIAVRRFMMFGKNKNKGVPVEPTKLAALIIDSYYQRGPLWESLQEDILLSQKYRDMYARFGRVYHGQQTRKKLVYREQSHINEIMHVTLPLENEEYAKLPGQPEWNNKDLLDDEDKL